MCVCVCVGSPLASMIVYAAGSHVEMQRATVITGNCTALRGRAQGTQSQI